MHSFLFEKKSSQMFFLFLFKNSTYNDRKRKKEAVGGHKSFTSIFRHFSLKGLVKPRGWVYVTSNPAMPESTRIVY